MAAVHALVVTTGGPDLPEVLSALTVQTTPPDLLTVVTVGEVTLPELPPEVQVVSLKSADNFGQALRQVITSTSQPDWYWLLHDDARPEPRALTELMRAASQGAAIAAVGPKQVGWDAPQVLLELGIEATATGRRVPLGTEKEIDQGQYDDRVDVLAAGSAGLLVRADAWHQLHGFDPHLGPYGDGLEFGRRLRRAGYRVVVAPKARVAHRRASLERGEFRRRREAQLYNWLLGTVALWAALLIPLLALWSVARALARLIMRQPRLAGAELGAYLDLLWGLPALIRGRRRLARVSVVPRRQLRPLEASAAGLENRRRLARRVARHRPKPIDQLDQISRRLLAEHRRGTRLAFLTALGIPTLLSLYFWYPLLGGFTGGSWAELPGSLWDQAWSPWVAAGSGAPGPVNPALPLLSIFWLNPPALTQALLVAALPLAAAGGWLVARLFTHSPAWRLGAALTWALQPLFLEAIGRGDLSLILVWLGLAPVLVGLWRATLPAVGLRVEGVVDTMITSQYDPLTWGAVAAIGLLAVGAGSPALIVPAAVLGYLLAATGTRQALSFWAVTLAWVPAALVGAPSLVTSLEAALTPTGGFARVGAQSILTAWEWAGAGVLLLAALASLLYTCWPGRGRPWLVRSAWLGAVASVWVLVGTDGEPGSVRATLFLSLLVAALGAAGPSTLPRRTRWVGAGASLATAAGLASFVGLLVVGPLAPGTPAGLSPHPGAPLVAREAAASERSARTLVLTQTSEQVEAQLRRDGTRGQEDLSAGLLAEAANPAREHLADAVGQLTARPSTEAAQALADHAVEIILLTPTSPVGYGSLHDHLDATEGLERIGTTDLGTMWRVRPGGRLPALATLGPEGRPLPAVSVSLSEPTTLTLAETADPSWRAWLGSVELEPTGSDWRQAFAVPAGEGLITFRYQPPWLRWWQVGSWVAVGLVALAAVPWRPRRARWEVLDGS
ncbi:glycosyltransferase [Actinomyces sp. F1_1611]